MPFRVSMVPATPSETVTVTFRVVNRFARLRSETGLFRVDDASGHIGSLLPGDRGYSQAALAWRHRLFGRSAPVGSVASIDLAGGSFFGLYLVQNGTSAQATAHRSRHRPTVFLSFPKANSDRLAHVRRLAPDLVTWEDQTRGGDRDYNDLFVQIKFGPARSGPVVPIGPGPGGQDVPPTVAISSPASALLTNHNIDIAGNVADDIGVSNLRAWIFRSSDAMGTPIDVPLDPISGLFRFPTSLKLDGTADGTYTVELVATDTSGQASSPAQASFVLDATPPPITLGLAPESDSAPVGDGMTTLDSIRLVGQTEPNLAVTLVGTTLSTTADAQGFFSFAGLALPLGSTTYTARAVDAAGNVGTGSDTVTYCGFDANLTGWTVAQTGGSPTGQGSVTSQDCQAVLREGDSFTVSLSRTFLVPASPTTVSFEFANLKFDTTDPAFINDAFEVALLGDNGRPIVPAFAPDKDAFFNVTEGLNVAKDAGVAVVGSVVTVDISQAVPGTRATLTFRLVNNDSDTTTSVAIVSARFPQDHSSPQAINAATASGETTIPTGRTFPARSAIDASTATHDLTILDSFSSANQVRPLDVLTTIPAPDVIVSTPTNGAVVAAGTSVVIAGRAVASQPLLDSSSNGTGEKTGLVDFETVPGADVTEGQAIGNQFFASQGMSFTLEGGAAPLLAQIGSPRTAFDGPGGLPDQPAAGQNVGRSFLTVPVASGTPAPLIIRYAGPVSEAGGVILDIDTSKSRLTVFQSDGTPGYYNESIGNRLDGTSDLFPIASDPVINDAPEPDLSSVADVLGDWLSPNAPPANGDWIFQAIPTSWPVTSETAIVYEIDGGPGGVRNLRASFGVDNGIFVWLNGEYKFGAESPGGVGVYEYPDIPLGDLRPGKNYLQVLREDHGTQNGSTIKIIGELVPADGWRVEARDSDERVLETLILGPDTPGAGDGLATGWAFRHNTADIASVRISYVGTADDGLGFAFDNFTSLQPGTDPGTDGPRARNAITSVTVNGKPVDVLDAAGRFFTRVDVLPGQNRFDVVATDAYDQTATTGLTLVGEQRAAGDVDFSTLADITASFTGEYARTSFHRDDRTLFAEAAVRNVGGYPVDAPLFVAIDHLSNPAVMPLDAAGYTPGGLPYYDVSPLVSGKTLDPSELTRSFQFSFWNPDGVRFAYDLVFFGLLNRPSAFTSVPTVEAISGRPYRYDADAEDPDNDAVRFSLQGAPGGMTIDAITGVIAWIPSAADLGTHPVEVVADDGRGGVTRQLFDIGVIVAPPNRPPVFTSLPVGDANVGLVFTYDADAADPDVDTLTFSLSSGPDGMTIAPATGVLSWKPGANQIGQAEVTVQVTDGRGGMAMQSYSICVGEALGNHAPVIVSQPVTTLVPRSAPPFGKIIVANDEWTLSDVGFGAAPDTPRFVKNLLDEFTHGRPGSFLAYSNNFGLTGQQLRAAVEGDGNLWTVSTHIPFTSEFVTQFDAIFVGGDAADCRVLIDYVRAGGNVYLMGGSGTTGTFGDAPVEAAAWNPFLSVFGLAFAQTYNGIGSGIPPRVEFDDLPLFAGVESLYQDIGQSVIDLDPDDHLGVIVGRQDGQGLYAVYDPNAFPQGNFLPNGIATSPAPEPGLVANWDFETPIVSTFSTLFFGSTVLDGWEVTGATIDIVASSFFMASSGIQSIDLTGTPGAGGLRRTLSLQPGRPYVLQFDFAGNPNNGPSIKSLDVLIENQTYSFTFDITGRTSTDMGWQTKSIEFVPSSSNTTIQFVSRTDGNAGPAIDNVTLKSMTSVSSYFYDVEAVDPDGDTLTYSLVTSPDGMTINPSTGIITWAADAGPNLVSNLDFSTGNAAFRTDLDFNPASGFDAGVYTVASRARPWHGAAADFGDHTTGTGLMMLVNGSTEPDQLVWAEDVPVTSGTKYEFSFWARSWTSNAPGRLQLSVNGQAVGTELVLPSDTNSWVQYQGTWNSGNASTASIAIRNATPAFDGNDFALDDISFATAGGSVIAGQSFPVTVRVEDGRGGSDEQTFALIVSESGGEIRGTKWNDLNGNGVRDGLNEVRNSDFEASHQDFRSDLTFFTTTHNGAGQYSIGTNPRDFYGLYGSFGDHTTGYGLMMIVNGETATNGVVWEQQIDVTSGVDYTFSLWAASTTAASPARLQFYVNGQMIGQDLQLSSSVGLWQELSAPWNSGAATVATVSIRNFTGEFGGNDFAIDDIRFASASVIEPGLPGWTIYLDQNVNGRLDPGERSTTTDANGEYVFGGVAAGSYVAAEVLRTGWRQTAPGSGTHVVSLAGGQTIDGLDFGNQAEREPANRSPKISGTPAGRVEAGQLWKYGLLASDPDGDTLTFDLPTAPPGMTVHPTLGVVVWTPTADQVGPHTVVLRAKDSSGGIAIQSFSLQVTAANAAPAVGSTPPGPASVGHPYRYAIRAQDAEGDAFTFRLVSGPAGLAVDPSGLLTFLPAANQAGSQPVVVEITDARQAKATYSFNVDVRASAPNTSPVIESSPRRQAWQGSEYVGLVRASDPDGDPLTFELVKAPAGMTINAPAAGVLRWTPTADQLGKSFEVVVRVLDGRGGTATQTFPLEVLSQASNRAPSIVSTPLQTAVVDRNYALVLESEDPDGDPVTYRLVSAPRGMSIDPERGTLLWRPTEDQMGPNEVIVEARDIFLATATQRFTVVVSCINQSPAISSRPPTEAWAGEAYVYAIRADDPENDTLTFSLLAKPAGMTIDAATGRIRWTPALTQPTTESVSIVVSDGQGNLATQSYQIEAKAVARNRAPVITSRPKAVATAGSPYSYDVEAVDPEGMSPTYSLDAASLARGMTIQPKTGLIVWSPAEANLGSTLVVVTATDPEGARAIQTYLLDVVRNQPPAFSNQANPGPATAGGVFRFDTRVTDSNGDAITYELRRSPPGVTVDGLGRVRWEIPVGSAGTFPISIVARDPQGLEAVRSFDLVVRPDTQAPKVQIIVTPNTRVNPGTLVTFRVVASDDVRVSSLGLSVNGEALLVGPDGVATKFMNSIGVYTVIATATDLAGNTGGAQATVGVIDPANANRPLPGTPGLPPNPGVNNPSDTKAPVVSITSPGFETKVTSRVPIIGTVDDPENDLWYYRVLYAPVDAVDLSNLDVSDPDWKVLKQGDREVVNGELATFDPTNLPRDPYAIVVAAYDLNGQGTVSGVTVSVEGGLLLGNFHVELTDLQVPLAGIPIAVTHVYDTTNSGREGDFGYGWSLGVQDARVLETVRANDDYLAGKTKVYLTGPDGRRVGFTYQERVVGGGSIFGAIFGTTVEPYFVADPGVYETLEIPEKAVTRGGIVAALSGPFNPDVFILTTRDGTRYTYDQEKGLERIDDRNGNSVTFTDQGIAHSSGARINFERDYRGRITKITQIGEDGGVAGVIRYAYDAAGDLRSVTDQEGNTTRYEYRASPRHYLDRAVDPRGIAVLRVEYEPVPGTPGALRFVAVRDGLGNAVDRRDYSGLDSRTAIVRDGNGNETMLLYDDRGNVLRESDPLGNATVRTYGDPRNPDLETRIIDRRGFVTDKEYDARGNVAKIVERGTLAAPIAQPIVTAFTYDDRNNVRTITNDKGQATTFGYDGRATLTSITNAQGDSSRFTYDAQGRRKTFTDFNGNTTTFGYEEGCPCGSPHRVDFPDGNYQELDYNDLGQVVREATFERDGRLVEIKTTAYDRLGRVTEEVSGQGAGRIATRKVYDRNLLDYEVVVNPASPNETPATPVALRKSRITDYDYDANGRMTRQVNPDGGAVEFRYDAQGNRILLQDPVGNVTTWAYDGRNRVAEERDPFYWAARGLPNIEAIVSANRLPSGVDLAANRGADHVTASGYDAEGNRVELIDRDGRRSEFSYDQAGRKTQERWYAAGTDALVRTMTWSYDTLGNLLSAQDPDSRYTYTYDALNRVKTVDNTGTPGGPRAILTYGYDKQGNVVSTSDNLGVMVSSEYDARNRLSVRKWSGTGVDPVRIDFRYNAAGRQTLLERFSGLDRSKPAGRTVTTYEPTGQVDTLTHRNAVDAVLASYDYDYDFGGLVVDETRTNQDARFNQTITYGYDLNGQLVDADYDSQPDEHFGYDFNGDRTVSRNGTVTTTYTTGTANQIQSDEQFNYVYDREGNLTRKTEIATGAVTTYIYDHRKQRVSVEERDGAGVIRNQMRFVYDVDGRRIAKVGGAGDGRTIYNGDNAWADVAATGIAARYLFTNGIDKLLARKRGGEEAVFYLTDRLGTVRDLADDLGSPVDHVEYGIFGSVIMRSNPADGDRYLFTGREYDSETGSYYFRTRHYSPLLGRFGGQDQLGFAAQDTNLYRYAFNDPANLTDPSGRSVLSDYGVQLSRALGPNNQQAYTGSVIGFVHGITFGTLWFTAYFLQSGKCGEALQKTQATFDSLKDFLTRVRGGYGFAGLESRDFLSAYINGYGFDANRVFVGRDQITDLQRVLFGKTLINSSKTRVGGLVDGVWAALEFFEDVCFD